MIRRLLLAAALLLAAWILTPWASPPWASTAWVSRAWAVEPSERLADPGLEARARAISRELRCLVCQNESIDESQAGLAHDLRVLVRQRLTAGDSDHQVLDYIVARYGVFVLLDPPFEPLTWLLWLGPPVLVAGAGAALLLRALRRRVAATLPDPNPPELTRDEAARAAALLGDRA